MNNKKVDYTPIQNEYPKLNLFKGWVLTNFPFIEEDFDSLTNYEMICKLTGYLNEVIKSQNLVEEDMKNLFEAYTKLQTFVNTYFDNLDVQKEIDTKLDEMVTDGTLDRIINTNIFNDLNNKVNKNISDINTNNQNINSLNNSIVEYEDGDTISIGDSYGRGYQPGGTYVDGWTKFLGDRLKCKNYYTWSEGASGFPKTGEAGHTFLTLLQAHVNEILDKNSIKNIIVCGGTNDRNYTRSDIVTAIQNFINYCKVTFPNATVYIGFNGNMSNNTDKVHLSNTVLPAYESCTLYGAIFLNGVENIMKNYLLMSSDGVHPTSTGYMVLGNMTYEAFKKGNTKYYMEVLQGSYTDDRLDLTVTQENTIRVYSCLSNDIVNVFFTPGYFRYTTPIVVSEQTDFRVLKQITLPNYRTNNVYFTNTVVPAFAYDGSGYIAIMLMLKMGDDGSLLGRIISCGDTTSVEQITIKNLIIPYVNMVIPTRFC